MPCVYEHSQNTCVLDRQMLYITVIFSALRLKMCIYFQFFIYIYINRH